MISPHKYAVFALNEIWHHSTLVSPHPVQVMKKKLRREAMTVLWQNLRRSQRWKKGESRNWPNRWKRNKLYIEEKVDALDQRRPWGSDTTKSPNGAMANRRALAFSRSFLPKKKTFFFLSIFCPLAEPMFPLPSFSKEKGKTFSLKPFTHYFLFCLGIPLSYTILYLQIFVSTV